MTNLEYINKSDFSPEYKAVAITLATGPTHASHRLLHRRSARSAPPDLCRRHLRHGGDADDAAVFAGSQNTGAAKAELAVSFGLCRGKQHLDHAFRRHAWL